MTREKPSFSKPFDDSLICSELVIEMMRVDGLDIEDHTILEHTRIRELLYRHANAALRVMRRIEEREANIRPSQT